VTPHSPSRALAQALLTLALVAGSLEAGSFAFFRWARDRFSFADPASYTIDAARVPGLASHFDATLGWTNRYHTPLEERPQPRRYGRTELAAFGDSYTHCDEVGDAETWEAYLADELQADVLNFGVGAYGPDQALLRYRQKARALATTPVVALGVVLENVNRLVNTYRPFYYRDTGVPLTKPRFVQEAGALRLLPNPIQRAQDLGRLADPAFVDAIGAQDFWYSRGDLPRLGFPYARLLMSPAVWRQALEGGRGRRSEIAERPARNLWKDPQARALFLAIVDAFATDVAAAGARPLFVILPGKPHVDQRRAGQPIPGYEPVKAHLEERSYDRLDGIAELSASDEPSEALFRPGGHLSPLANRMLARALAAALCSRARAGTH
jgi:hypothetical protein